MRRSDGWTLREDKFLLETLLDYIRHGKTRVQGFEDVGERIGRTPGAVAFRWNGTIAKRYRNRIREVEKERIYRVHYGGRIKKNKTYKENEVVKFYRAIMEENERLKHDLENYKQLATLIMSIDIKGSKQSLAKGTCADDLGKN